MNDNMVKRNRNQSLTVRFTPDEKKRIQAKAKKENKTITQLIIDKVLEDEKKNEVRK